MIQQLHASKNVLPYTFTSLIPVFLTSTLWFIQTMKLQIVECRTFRGEREQAVQSSIELVTTSTLPDYEWMQR